MTELIGKTFGKYQIIEQIGIGGMATVYRAYQANMDRYVAIKVLPQKFAEDPTFTGRFEQEARTIAKLEHKHILPVYDYGEQDGYTYLVMRYIGTGNLKDVTQRGALPLANAVRYLSQIAEALQYAHDHGVIHRDVKTSNVLLDDNKETYLTDFGIAKLAAGTSQFTGTGTLIGTPAYMSPEQCSGMPVDARSDIYSLGIVLYEMLTGNVPFDAETPVAVVLKQIQEPLPSPRTVNPAIPQPIEQVVFKALAKDADHRYQSAGEMGAALRVALAKVTETPTDTVEVPVKPPVPGEAPTAAPLRTHGHESTMPMQPARRRPRGWMWLVALVMLVLGAIVVGLILSDRDDEDTDEINSAAVTEAVTDEADSVTPTLPPSTDTSGTPVAAAGADETTESSDVEPGWTVFTNTQSDNPANRQLVATENGGLWMATEGGLLYWAEDGTYTKYTSADGLAFNEIHTIARDTTGDVWIANRHVGVMRLAVEPDGTITNREFFDSGNSNLQSDSILALLPESDGTLLAGTYETYLERWTGEGWTTPDFPTPSAEMVGDEVWLLERTNNGTLWAAGPAGLAYWDGEAWAAMPLPDDLTSQDDQLYRVAWMYEDPADGAIWMRVFTEPDYDYYMRRLVPGEDWTWEAAPDWMPNDVRDMLRASDGALWLVLYSDVIRVDGESGRRESYGSEQGIAGYAFQHIVEDDSGTIWLSTNTALVRFEGRRWRPFVVENEPAYNQVAAMTGDAGGTLWFASRYGDIFTYADGVWTTVTNLDTDLFTIAAHDGAIWVGSTTGLYRGIGEDAQQYTSEDGLSSDSVLALATDPNDPALLWIGTPDGISRLNTTDDTIDTWELNTDSLPGPSAPVLHVDENGTLWAGVGYHDEWTDDGSIGLLRFDGTDWTVAAAEGNPFSDEETIIWSMTDDGTGGLWVGTNQWVHHWDGDQWRTYTDADGAPHYQFISGIVTDEEGVWVATSYEGLYRLDSVGWYRLGNEGTGTVYLNSLYRASDGALWILTDTGITRLVGDPMTFDE